MTCSGAAFAQSAQAVEDRRVDILRYRVEGNTVLPQIEVERAIYPFLGPDRPVEDVEQARAALEKVYRDRGYETVAVRVPQQDVRNGVVRFEVTELRVGRLRVTGAEWTSPEEIREKAPSLAEGTVPNYNAVSGDLAALNTSRDRVIAPVLRAGETPDTVDVDLEVTESAPFHWTAELNDRYSSRTERLRASASVTYGNLWQADHSISLQGQFTPEDPDQSWLVSGSYVAPIAGTPLTLVAYGVHNDSDIGAVGGINVLGSGDIAGLRAIYSIPGDSVYQSLTAGIDYKSFGEDLVLGGDTASTPIDYIPLSLAYGLNHRGRKLDANFNLSLNMGLRGLAATNAEFRAKRSRASANWIYLRSSLDILYRLPADLQLSIAMAGQLSGEPLISNEGFAIGGLDSVRGYLESQDLGDLGFSQQIELRSPAISGGALNELRFFAFTDMGITGIRKPLPVNGVVDDGTRLLSAGGGLRARFFDNVNLMLLLAAPLRNEESVDTDFGDLRGQFRLWLDF
ncbi:ShlB/FhaC/HecB family hemolysin secretion/activation protein [Pelagerythrobacter marensis]|nr:ShlB/FhaC/HecB family hemolysin secretion/activation protein [Pelagerythrobacter marensis]